MRVTNAGWGYLGSPNRLGSNTWGVSIVAQTPQEKLLLNAVLTTTSLPGHPTAEAQDRHGCVIQLIYTLQGLQEFTCSTDTTELSQLVFAQLQAML